MQMAVIKRESNELLTRILRHDVFTLAGSLAYTTALALAPFVLIVLSVAALLGQNVQDQLYAQMEGVLGGQAGEAVRLIVENADKHPTARGFSGVIGLAILAFSASAIFSQLRTTLDRIDERVASPEASGVWAFIRDKFLSVGLVFGFVLLAITSLSVTTAISIVFRGGEEAAWSAVSFVVSFAVFAGLFTLIFRFIPSERLPWRRAMISGLWGAVFFLVGKSVIGLYLGRASVGSSYGAAGSLIVFLVWVYYTTVTLLISYEFTNSVILDESKPAPRYT